MIKNIILAKQKQAAEILKEQNIDMWIIFVRETGNIKDPMLDMLVGTGATWHSAFIITKEGDTVAIVGSLEKANMKKVGTFKKIVSYLKSIKGDFIEVLEKYDPQRIAINYSKNSILADGLTHGMYLELTDLLKDTPYVNRFISSEDVISALRGRKSESELQLMKQAINETLSIYDKVTDFIKEGKTEKDIANFVLDIVREKGLELSWDKEHCPAVFTGPDSAGAHSGPTDRIIEKGHIVNLDFGVKVDGYASDLQRTWYICRDGEDNAPEEVLKGFNVIKEAIQLSAKKLKPGIKAYEVDLVARNYIVKNGYEEYPHGLGHQIGRLAHESGARLCPRWDRYGKTPYIEVEDGEVYTLEPRLTIPGYGIATIEEEVVVTKDGCKFLSDIQIEIILIKS